MKVGLAQINPAVGDFRGNSAKIQSFYQDAVRQDCGLVVFPELALTGYHPRDLLLRRSFVSAANKALETLARRIGHVPAVVGTVTVNPNAPGRCLFNTAALLRNGNVEALFHKRLLASHDVVDEDRYFEAGPESGCFDAGGIRIGVAIGHDLWNDADFWEDRRSALDPVKELVAQDCRVIVNPTACAWSLGKQKLRRAMIDTMAHDDGLEVLVCNLVGSSDGLIFDGGSVAVSDEGLLASGKAFQEDLVVVDVNAGPIDDEPAPPEEQQLIEGLVLGVRDHLSKAGQRKAIVPLTGINGAVAAVIVARAADAKNVHGIALKAGGVTEEETQDARALAERLAIDLDTVDAGACVDAVHALVKRDSEAETPGAPNRHPTPKLEAFLLSVAAEKHEAAFISTADKTDMALAGAPPVDSAGSIAALGDVPKTIVIRLAEFINRDEEIIPPGIIDRARPTQDAEGKLNPQLVDAVVARYVDEDMSVDEIVADGFDRTVVKDLVRKIDHAESMRHRSPPCLAVTSRAFGPGRRMPLAQRFTE